MVLFKASLGAAQMPLALLPTTAHAVDLPRCAIASIQIESMTHGLPSHEPQFAEGRVLVECSSIAPHSQKLEFGLIEVPIDPKANDQGAPRPAPPPNMRVDLFSDGPGHKALPQHGSTLNHFPTEQTIPRAGISQLSIAFNVRIVTAQWLAAAYFGLLGHQVRHR